MVDPMCKWLIPVYLFVCCVGDLTLVMLCLLMAFTFDTFWDVSTVCTVGSERFMLPGLYGALRGRSKSTGSVHNVYAGRI